MFRETTLPALFALACGVILVVAGSEGSLPLTLQRLKRQPALGGVCKIPEPLQHGRYFPSYIKCPTGNESSACMMIPGTQVPPDWTLHFTCDEGYIYNLWRIPFVECANGRWDPALPLCVIYGEEVNEQGGALVKYTPQHNKTITSTGPQPEVRKSAKKCQEYGRALSLRKETTMGDGITCRISNNVTPSSAVAQPGEYPHMAQIGFWYNGTIKWFCVGSLISEQYVLSVASCKYYKDKGNPAILVRLGDFGISSSKYDVHLVKYDILEIIVHPEYSGLLSYHNNIALFKLREHLKFQENLRPICLHTEDIPANTYAITTGWKSGSEDETLTVTKGNVTIVGNDNRQCISEYKDLTNFSTSLLCAKSPGNEGYFCYGDSAWGAPLQVRLQTPYCMYSLVGIYTRGLYCDSIIYTRVAPHVPWIESVVWP